MPLGFIVMAAVFLMVGFGSFLFLRPNESIATTPGEETIEEGSDGENEPELSIDEGISGWEDSLLPLQLPELKESFESLVSLTFNSLQEVVDVWAATYGSNLVAVETYDVTAGMVVAGHRANAQMRPRSIYKLFYLYDAYAQVDAGQDSLEQELIPGYSLGTCLDLMIRYSNNSCAEVMLDDPARSARVG